VTGVRRRLRLAFEFFADAARLSTRRSKSSYPTNPTIRMDRNMKIEGCTALVTGAKRGLGKA
jgi:hypothetical protein